MSDPFNKAYSNTGSFMKAVEEHKNREPQRKEDAHQKSQMKRAFTDVNELMKSLKKGNGTGSGTGSGVGMGTGSGTGSGVGMGTGSGKEHGIMVATHLNGKGHAFTKEQTKKLLKHIMAKYKKHLGVK